MSDSNPTPPPIPSLPALPPPAERAQAALRPLRLPLGEDPQDCHPITGPLSAVESILRHPRRVFHQLGQPQAGTLILGLLVVAVACSLIYGVVMGAFSAGPQLWAAPTKIAVGLLLSALICLPSLYIFSCLNGSHARLVQVAGLIAGLLALMTVLLVGFAPVAWIFSQSTESLPAMGALHLAFWLVATFFGVRFLSTGFAHLSGGTASLRLWTVIFILVMVQMTTALRPIVGTADTFLPTQKKLFVVHWLEQLSMP